MADNSPNSDEFKHQLWLVLFGLFARLATEHLPKLFKKIFKRKKKPKVDPPK